MIQTRPEGHYHVDGWPVKPEHEHGRTPAAIAIHLGHDGHNAFIVACEQHPAGSALAGGAPTGLLSTGIIIASLLGGHLGVSHQECESSQMQPGVGHVVPCVYASVAGQHHLIVITVQHHAAGQFNPVCSQCQGYLYRSWLVLLDSVKTMRWAAVGRGMLMLWGPEPGSVLLYNHGTVATGLLRHDDDVTPGLITLLSQELKLAGKLAYLTRYCYPPLHNRVSRMASMSR